MLPVTASEPTACVLRVGSAEYPLVPRYVGRSEDGMRQWQLWLAPDAPELLVVPSDIRLTVDVLPGRSSVELMVEHVQGRIFCVLPLPKDRA